jgi:hypothetical protein
LASWPFGDEACLCGYWAVSAAIIEENGDLRRAGFYDAGKRMKQKKQRAREQHAGDEAPRDAYNMPRRMSQARHAETTRAVARATSG